MYKILSENKNSLMNRKDLKLELDHPRSSTVSKADVQKAVADKEKVPVTHVEVRTIITGRGSTKSIADVEVYTESKAKDYSVKAEQPKA